MKYDFGTCGECHYSIEQVTKDYPNGTGGQELQATSVVKVPEGGCPVLTVIPHRPTCIFYVPRPLTRTIPRGM